MITSQQLEMLAFQGGQWYNSVIVQGRRFLDALDAAHGQFPWEDGYNIFLPEKMFLITAIYHTISYLKRLDKELQIRGDTSFHPFLEKIASTAEQVKIQKWRNLDEHSLEYLVGEGKFPGEDIRTVDNGEYQFKILATATFVHGGIGVFMIGDVDIGKLLIKFKENQTAVLQKIEAVFNNAYKIDAT